MGILSNGYVKIKKILLLLVVVAAVNTVSTRGYGEYNGNFNDAFEPTFGDNRVKTYGKGGQLLSLSLDQTSGSGFRSKKEFLFGRFDMQMKFVAGNSAGTVTTFYLSSEGNTHDEIDFEFLGNVSGQPYTFHTNVYSQGKGDKEQQFHLWFDPTKNFHTYTILWNPSQIIFMVDEIPIRVHKNDESLGVPFPKNQPMKIYSSFWEADDWATQGGRVKTDWSKAPFTAYYRNYNIDACEAADGPSCATSPVARDMARTGAWKHHDLGAAGRKRLRWVQQRHMIYDYCRDLQRFHHSLPPECQHSRV